MLIESMRQGVHTSPNLLAGVMQNFWTRLASKYGTKKYWQEKGEEAAIVNAVRLSDHK